MKKLLFAGLLFLLPSISFAAGFANAPLFLSRTPVTEGQTVRIIGVIENSDATSFSGLLVFFDGSTRIGSTTVTLDSGATQTASVNWKPAAGTHNVNAELIAGDGSITQQVSATFVINAVPQPVNNASTNGSGANQTAASIDSSAAIQKDIAGVSPQVASASVPVFTVIDGARNSIADTLDSQIQNAKQKIAANPKTAIIPGATFTQDPTIQNPVTGVWYWVYNIYYYILLALRWLVGNAGVFYPVLAFLFLYILWRMYRSYRRPSWER